MSDPTQPPFAPTAGPAILLVEDDAAARLVTAATLDGAGYAVTAAPDGETALALLAKQPYVLVITDIRMRKVDGIDVLRAAREQPYRPAVVLLTGYGSLDTSIAALRMGAYDYLLKPCDPDVLLDTAAAAIQHQAQERQREDMLNAIIEIAARLQGQSAAPAPPSTPSSSVAPPAAAQQQVGASPTPAPPAPTEPERHYLRIGALIIDYFRHEVTFEDQIMHTTPTEYALICCLAESRGRVLTYSEIVRHTHGHAMPDDEALLLLKQHIHNLRRKIPVAYLVNVRGTGYMMVGPEEGQL